MGIQIPTSFRIINTFNMVCSINNPNTKSISGPVKKSSSVKKAKKSKNIPMEKEIKALKSLIPDKNIHQKSDFEVILQAIGYIQTLEDKLMSQSSADLLKAKYIAAHRMNLLHNNED